MSLNGIWKVEVPGLHDWESSGTTFLEDGVYRGASENHYMVGTYEVSGNQVKISAAGEQHGQGRTMFGKREGFLELRFEGEINGDEIQGQAQDAAGDFTLKPEFQKPLAFAKHCAALSVLLTGR